MCGRGPGKFPPSRSKQMSTYECSSGPKGPPGPPGAPGYPGMFVSFYQILYQYHPSVDSLPVLKL